MLLGCIADDFTGATDLANTLTRQGMPTVVLLANHGPVVAGTSLTAAVNAIEELEQTAHLMLLLRGRPTQLLTAEQVADLNRRFPS